MTPNENCYLHQSIGETREVYESGICLDCWRWAEENFPPEVTEAELREAFISTNQNPPTIVRTILTDLGWHYEPQTGGNCTAYSKPTHNPSAGGGYPEGWYYFLTDAMDPIAPTRANQKVTVGLYDHEGRIVSDWTFTLNLLLYGELVFEDSYA